jgi:hypothetical protein
MLVDQTGERGFYGSLNAASYSKLPTGFGKVLIDSTDRHSQYVADHSRALTLPNPRQALTLASTQDGNDPSWPTK